jgi:hypothetical protein
MDSPLFLRPLPHLAAHLHFVSCLIAYLLSSPPLPLQDRQLSQKGVQQPVGLVSVVHALVFFCFLLLLLLDSCPW